MFLYECPSILLSEGEKSVVLHTNLADLSLNLCLYDYFPFCYCQFHVTRVMFQYNNQ